MAKKATTKRVFQLAKELGVASKDVVAKCQSEEIPGITNHMSTVSLGLAQTIKEWFNSAGGGDVGTAVAPPVEAEKPAEPAPAARKKATRKAARKKADTTTPPADVGTVVEVEAPQSDVRTVASPATPAETTPPTDDHETETDRPSAPLDPALDPTVPPTRAPILDPAKDPTVPPVITGRPQADPTMPNGPSREVAEPLTPAARAPDAPGSAGRLPRTSAVPNVPTRPDIIKPAGPKLEKPDKVQLAGPKVIRVETPDVVPVPQPRARAGGPGGGRPGTRSPGGRGVGGPDPSYQPARGGGGPGGGPGGGAGGGGRPGSPANRRNKRRSATGREEAGRGGRTGAPGTGASRPFNWREQDLLERERRLNRSGGFFRAARRDNLKRTSGGGHRAQTAAQSGGSVTISEPITIKALSAATGVKTGDILKKMLLAGKPAQINSVIATEDALEIMVEYDIALEVIEQKTAEEQIVEQFEQREMTDERPRSPVVTILGHVDHGKTSLLDRIRQTKVAEGEAGGITQATSAFRVPVTVGDQEHLITFIDTPGHEAFTEMRSRGAKVTDLIVLVVAADDGVMPQTIESISHAKAAGVPIIVALNKIDKPEATDPNIQRILGQLAEHELNPVEWGGSTEVVRTSAIKDEGIQDLLETLDFQAQLLELKSDHGGRAEGTVIESSMAEGRGAVANILVQQGKLKKGDFLVVGRAFGRVRDIIDDTGKRIQEAGPCSPVAISGIGEVPDAGDKFYTVKNLKEAEAAAEERRAIERERNLATEKITLDNIFEKLSESDRKELPLIVKGDVQGSVDTLVVTLQKISTDDITITVKHSAVGGVNDSDILLAEATGAIIIGFNVTSTSKARKEAESKGVDVRLYDVIYDITDDVTKAAEGLLEPEYKLEVLGHAEVREVFKVSKVGMIAGCYVTDGTIQRNAQIRVTRGGIVVEKDRRLDQLKHFKDDAKEVRAGQECGMKIEGYNDIKTGDILECYKTLEVKRKLNG